MKTLVATSEAYSLLHCGSIAFARCESSGIRIDTDYLDQTIARTGQRITNLEAKLKQTKVWKIWVNAYGEKSNLNSRTQLGNVVFNLLKYPCHHYTAATGKPSTAEEDFEDVDLPFVKGWLRYMDLCKLKATFLEGLRRETIDGFCHPFLNLHTATTYRSSSGGDKEISKQKDFNFQNLPIRKPLLASAIRPCVIPRKGHKIAEIDFSAHEFKLAASVWDDPRMIEYASDPKKDVHRDWGAKCYLLESDQVSKDTRQWAKTHFVFPHLYGSYYRNIARNLWDDMNKFGLRVKLPEDDPRKPTGPLVSDHLQSLGIKALGACDPRKDPAPGTFEFHIRNVEWEFDREFSVFATGREKRWNDYLATGQFRLKTGFVIQGMCTKNYVMNSVVQGPAFHCLLWCIIRLQEEFDQRGLMSLILGQIHDCALVDIDNNEIQEVLSLAHRIMTQDIREAFTWIKTPLDTEVDVVEEGESWHQKRPWIVKDGVWGPK